SECTVLHCFGKFRREKLNEGDRGRPSAVDKDHVKALVEANAWTNIHYHVEELSASVSTVPKHLKKIAKWKKLGK
ncbi:hypothetical protein Angca_005453, partial [Angiostrongylus cantonensis]